MSETLIDSLSCANLSQFHFLRPWWALALGLLLMGGAALLMVFAILQLLL